MGYKTCTKCGLEKPFSDFYKTKRGKHGLSAHCIVCDKAKYEANKEVQLKKQRDRYAANPEMFAERSKAYVEKNKAKVAARDSERKKRYRLENHEECLKKDAETRLKNAEKIAEYKRRYVENNLEELRQRRKDAYAAARESSIEKTMLWCRANPEKARANKLRWAKRNPDKVAAARIKRRNVRQQCVPLWANTEWDTFLVKEICDLARARTEVTGFVWHVDHKVPLVSKFVCGLHCSDNLQAIPAKLNLAKSNLYWEDMP